jgi:hypothetical protein
VQIKQKIRFQKSLNVSKIQQFFILRFLALYVVQSKNKQNQKDNFNLFSFDEPFFFPQMFGIVHFEIEMQAKWET